ncbi:MAG: T9SS type A sorting domain-containing protein [Bacteroides sp.]|nr:T9SS type A sorting domain-containing protein [Bacteroides sp.]
MIKKLMLSALAVTSLAPAAIAADWLGDDHTVTLNVFNGAIFYDGYAGLDRNLEADADDGILRHRNSLYAVPLTDEFLSQIGEKLDVSVVVEACCDNYDRIGNVNLALVPKGAETYNTADVQRLELGRFITPFMDMNRQPNQVPYSYWMDYLSPILRDANLRAEYDLWLELEIFGVPYAANQQISGCAGRNDVFKGYLDFITSDEPAPLTENNVLVPMVMKNPEYIRNNLNNYQEAATDEIGKTRKTYTFTVPRDVEDAQIVLITSNHGADVNGEEYNRRDHFVYYDGELILEYKPGRTSCEPFRKYNTQRNGIYGDYKRTDRGWQSFSNWCPGDVIDNRILHLGPVTAGEHSVVIDVPDAVFYNNDGDFPVSMFFQGSIAGMLPSSIDSVEFDPTAVFTVSTDGRVISVNTDRNVLWLEVHDMAGRCLRRQAGLGDVDATRWAAGTYLVTIDDADGYRTTQKVVLK